MDLLSASFVILMVVLGGVSAYVADILGYKIGKKRLSLWHIRPKYVARTTVVIAGALIPLVVVALWYVFSSGFRTWITKGQQAIEDAKRATAQVSNLQDQGVKLERRNASLENKNKIFESQISSKQGEIDKQDKELKAQASNLKDLNIKLDELRKQIESANELNKKTKLQFEQTKVSLKKSEDSLKEVQDKLATAKAEYEATKNRYDGLKTQYDQTSSRNLELTNSNLQLENANAELQKNLKELSAQVSDLTTEISSLKADKTAADKEAKEAMEKRDEIQRKLNEITVAMRQAFANSEVTFRTTPIVFMVGEELGRATIPAKISKSDATTLYRNLTRRARSIGSERGAQSDPVAFPFSGTAGFILTDKKDHMLNEDEVESLWISTFMNFKSDQVVVMNSAMNRVSCEALILRFDFFPNPIVFRKGEIIAESKIDGRLSDSEIRRTIREFLRTFVNTKARLRKMVPVVTRDGESYGQFTEDQFFDTFLRVKAIPRLLRLVAVAQYDTRAGDPLLINLELR